MAFPSDFQRRVDLTIPSAQIGAGTHAGLVVYVSSANIPPEMLDADGSFPCQANGADVRFSLNADGTGELPRQILLSAGGGGTNKVHLQNNPANGQFAAFVRLASVPSGSDFVFYMWYASTVTESEPTSGDAGFEEDTWQDYFSVYLFQETLANGAQLTDYSGNGRHGTWIVGSQPTQVARNAATQMTDKFQYDYTSTSDFNNGPIYCPLNFSTNDLGIQSFTFVWVGFFDSNNLETGGLIGCDRNGRDASQLGLWGAGTTWEFGSAGFQGLSNRLSLTMVVTDETWHFTRGVAFGAYDAGVEAPGGARRILGTDAWDNTDNLALFKGNRQGATGNGRDNDVRCEFAAFALFEMTAGRIETERNNYSSPATFITAGTPVTPVVGFDVDITGIVSDSEVRVYLGTPDNAAAATELAGQESVTTGTFSFSHSNGGAAAYIVVHKEDYEYLRLELTLPAGDTTIPVFQRRSRIYSNP